MFTNKRHRLYIPRHGQVVGFDRFPIYGHTDVDLTEIGVLQMEHLSEKLRMAPIQAVYASDLKRSVKGARIIARCHDIQVHVRPELREMNFGEWEGLTLDDIRDRYAIELDKRQSDLIDYAPPGGGESVRQLAERVLACLHEIFKQNQGRDFLILGHGGVNRVILCDALGLELSRMFSLHQDYGGLNIIDYFDDSTLVRMING